MLRKSLLVILPLLLSTSSVSADEVALVQGRIVGYYTGAAADPTHPAMVSALGELERQAREISRDGFLLSDGRWADIDYSAIPAGEWPAWDHFRRMTTLARAWATPGQALHRDPQLLARIESAILFTETFYGSGVVAEGNWWFWTIGPALDLGPTLVLVSDGVSQSVLETGISILRRRIGPFPGISSSWSVLYGQNAVWSSMNHLMLAVLTSDSQKLFQARDRMAANVRVTSSDGIQWDRSFHQHGKQLYTGGYGSSFAYDVSRYQLFTQQTSYELPATAGALFDDFMLDGIAFSLYGAWFDPSVIGREISKPWASGYNGVSALLHAAATDGPRRGEIAAAAAEASARWPWSLPVELTALAIDLDVAPSAPSGFRIYPESDYVAFRTSDWFASIRMLSTRTKSGESTNGEGLLGSRQADGRMHLTVAGDEYWDGAWAAMDWTRLPGITVERHAGAASNFYGNGGGKFVGAAGSDRGGVAAMDLAPLDSSVRAKKSWMFFPDAVVFLGSRIGSTSPFPVETIVDQRPVHADEPLVINGIATGVDGKSVRWAAGDDVGYWFPRPQEVRVEDEVRSGSWASLGTASADWVSRRIRTIRIDHGVQPRSASVEYVMVPGRSAAEMEQWANEAPIEILENGDLAAAVRDRRTGATGIVFWSATRAADVHADRPALVWLETDGRSLKVAVSDPSRSTPRVRVTFDGVWSLKRGSGATIVAASNDSTTVDVVVARGESTRFELQAPARRRAVRR
ncbi:MAG: polysaccharide lyase family 8 super-sandwich domain-containing protein [Thermoanaerobaculia bacterium]